MSRIEDYIPRLAENSLKRKLKSSGCVIVSDPKFCGKSTLCEQFAKSVTTLKTTSDIELANAEPASALRGDNPHLVDEWQKVPEIWNLIKDDLDKDYQFGKYLLTGSTTPVDPKMIQNSAAGRITPLLLRPFSLFESKESSGVISLLGLFDKNYKFTITYGQHNPISLIDIAHILCRGGWPIAVKADKDVALDVTENYYNGLFTIEDESDEFAEFLKNKNIELLKMILKSFARNISTEAKNTSMINDILASGERSTLDDETFLSYKKTLEDLFIIYDMPAWNLNLRTSVAVRSSPTHHFIDTSIATAALGIKPADLLNDLNSFGFFFEDMAVRDLSIYAESFHGELKHYRDSKGLEVDAILKLVNGEYGAIEIKIASDKNILEGINSLTKFESKMKENGIKTPTFKMILTSHGPSKKVGDIYIVPISMLGL